MLRNVASGVVAVDSDGRVSLANPRAEALLGGALRAGRDVRDARARADRGASLRVFSSRRGRRDGVRARRSTSMQLRGALTRLARGGAVVTLDDVTELARAQRVLAWGEMARQVAHEIKNPLTPIRLGVQHLRRARADTRVDFDRVLEQNVNQILTEIDRLDEIARAFSRYGAAPDERPRASRPTSRRSCARSWRSSAWAETSAVEWQEQGVDAPVIGLRARPTSCKEVLLNVLENARHARRERRRRVGRTRRR